MKPTSTKPYPFILLCGIFFIAVSNVLAQDLECPRGKVRVIKYPNCYGCTCNTKGVQKKQVQNCLDQGWVRSGACGGNQIAAEQPCVETAVALTNAQNGPPVNSVMGDISFVQKFGSLPTSATNENLRIQTHLSYVENLLRQQDVSSLTSELQQRRNHALDLLHDYWTRGVFPRNYDYQRERKPCFIDKDGTICAVGYLVEQTAGREAAEAINAKHKYDLITEMDDETVDDWINNSGLTKEECAMIQPSYSPCARCSGNKICVCRSNNCNYECKCINPHKAEQWIANGQPCNAKVNNKNSSLANEDGAAPKIIYPNLVSQSAIIPFSVTKTENVSIKIYDANGKLTTTLAEGKLVNGDYEMEWNIGKVSNGIYFFRMETSESSLTEKLILIK